MNENIRNDLGKGKGEGKEKGMMPVYCSCEALIIVTRHKHSFTANYQRGSGIMTLVVSDGDHADKLLYGSGAMQPHQGPLTAFQATLQGQDVHTHKATEST